MGCCCSRDPQDADVTDIELGQEAPEMVALLIGINYKNSKPALQLKGCLNDMQHSWEVATKSLGFNFKKVFIGVEDESEFKIDAKEAEYFVPNKENLKTYLRKIVKEGEQGTAVFMHFSGHGTQVKDKDGDEEDGKDEGFVSCDEKLISDDFLHTLVTENTRMIAIMDCCHSGTIWDIKHATPGKVICFSGCRDEQVAREVSYKTKSVGLLTDSLFRVSQDKKFTRRTDLQTLQKSVQSQMKIDPTQKCVLSVSDPGILTVNDILI